MSKPRALVCLAAGPSQQLLLEKSKALGYFIIGVDKNPDAPGFAWCDAEIVASTYEPAPIIEALENYQSKYDIIGVLNSSAGPPVITAAYLSEWLGLPGVNPETAGILTHKAMLTHACRENNIAVPEAFLESNANQIDYPCIVKPSISLLGKGGVALVENSSEFLKAVQNAKAISLDKSIEVEAYIPGKDVTLWAMVNDAGTLLPVVLFDENNGFRADGSVAAEELVIPSAFSKTDVEQAIIEIAQQVIQAFQLKRTPLLFSCRVSSAGKPYLIEIHLNIGGDQIFERLLPASCSFDLMSWAIDIMSGEAENLPALSFKKNTLVFQDNRHLGCELKSA